MQTFRYLDTFRSEREAKTVYVRKCIRSYSKFAILESKMLKEFNISCWVVNSLTLHVLVLYRFVQEENVWEREVVGFVDLKIKGWNFISNIKVFAVPECTQSCYKTLIDIANGTIKELWSVQVLTTKIFSNCQIKA